MITMKSLPVLALLVLAAACEGQSEPTQPNVSTFGTHTASTVADVDGLSTVLSTPDAAKIGTLRWESGALAGFTRVVLDDGGTLPGSLAISVGHEQMTANAAAAMISSAWNQLHATRATGQLMTIHDCAAAKFGDDEDCDGNAPPPNAVCKPSKTCETFTVDGLAWSECIELATDCSTSGTAQLIAPLAHE